MITTTDIANIIYTICREFRMPVYQEGNIPQGKPGAGGRVVIHVKEQTSEATWKKSFVEVNLFAADTPYGHADLAQLNDLEREAHRFLNGAGSFDGTPYRYTLASTILLDMKDLDAHYINAKVLFRSLNTME